MSVESKLPPRLWAWRLWGVVFAPVLLSRLYLQWREQKYPGGKVTRCWGVAWAIWKGRYWTDNGELR